MIKEETVTADVAEPDIKIGAVQRRLKRKECDCKGKGECKCKKENPPKK